MRPDQKAQVVSAPTETAGSRACLFGAECFALSWIAGLLSAFLHITLPAVCFEVILGAVLLHRRRKPELTLNLLGASLGMLAWLRYDLTVRRPLCGLDGQTVPLTGEITDTRIIDSDRACYTLRTELCGKRISIDWYADSRTPELKTGDRVTLSAALSRIEPDYRFHTAQYQAGQGRYLRIYSAELIAVQADTGFSLRRAVQNYRARITETIRMRLPEADAALLCAMLFGDKTELNPADKQALYRTGLGHITAVSGLHLVFFCAVLTWLFRLLHVSRRGQFLLLLPAIGLFLLLVDASFSVHRAACMLLITRSAALFGRRGDALRSLCITVFLFTALSPYVIGSVSFWLSVSGVFGIGIAAPYLVHRCGVKGGQHTALSLITVSAAVFPASVLLCGESSLIAPICNVIILPFSVAALYLGFSVLLSGGLTAGLLPLGGLLCRIVRTLADAFARLPFSHITVSSPAVRGAVLLCAGVFLLLLILRARPRAFGAALLASAVLLATVNGIAKLRAARELRVAVLGRKQEAVLVISSGGRTVAADLSNDVKNPQFVRAYLSEYGIDRLDALICTGRTAAAYQKELETVDVSRVILRDSTVWREGGRVCGVIPEAAGDRAFRLQLGRLTLTVDDGVLRVDRGSAAVIACRAKDEAMYEADAVIRYGGAPEAEDRCRLLLVPGAGEVPPGAETGRNQLLRIRPDGEIAVQSLESGRGIGGLYPDS